MFYRERMGELSLPTTNNMKYGKYSSHLTTSRLDFANLNTSSRNTNAHSNALYRITAMVSERNTGVSVVVERLSNHTHSVIF